MTPQVALLKPNPEILKTAWPLESKLKLDRAAVALGLETAYEDLISNWSAMLALQQVPAPIVGVMGLLNAGKSSLVRGFLSPEAAARVLCGISSEAGTQRFVFWLPQRWRESPLVWQSFKDELHAVFGGGWEELSEDPATAARQYNGDDATARLFGVPLIGFDSHLDELGFGLLDCPDFERVHPGTSADETKNIRLDFVRRASRLMSAALIVVDRAKIASEAARACGGGDLDLEGIDRYLLVNFVKPSEGVTRLRGDRECRLLCENLGVARLWAAYDYDTNNASELIPDLPEDHRKLETPVFFEVGMSEEENRKDRISDDRLIGHRLRALKPADMWATKIAAQGKRLAKKIDGLELEIDSSLAKQKEQLAARRKGVIDFVRSQLSSGGNLAFPVPPEVAAQIAQGVIDTAPFWAKPSLKLSRTIQTAMGKLKGWAKSARLAIDPTGEAKAEFEALRSNIGSSKDATFFNVEEWVEESLNQKFMPDEVQKEPLQDAWQAAFDHAIQGQFKLDPEAVGDFGKELWQKVPVFKKLILAGSGPFLLIISLGVLAFGAFDGGAGAIMWTYSLKQFFGAMGLGLVGAPLAAGRGGQKLEREILERTGVPFYTRLLKASLDVFHLPRGLGRDESQSFKNTGKLVLDLMAKPGETSLGAIVDLSEGQMIGEVIPGAWKELRSEMENHES